MVKELDKIQRMHPPFAHAPPTKNTITDYPSVDEQSRTSQVWTNSHLISRFGRTVRIAQLVFSCLSVSSAHRHGSTLRPRWFHILPHRLGKCQFSKIMNRRQFPISRDEIGQTWISTKWAIRFQSFMSHRKPFECLLYHVFVFMFISMFQFLFYV